MYIYIYIKRYIYIFEYILVSSAGNITGIFGANYYWYFRAEDNTGIFRAENNTGKLGGNYY